MDSSLGERHLTDAWRERDIQAKTSVCGRVISYTWRTPTKAHAAHWRSLWKRLVVAAEGTGGWESVSIKYPSWASAFFSFSYFIFSAADLLSFYRWEECGPEGLKELYKVTQLSWWWVFPSLGCFYVHDSKSSAPVMGWFSVRKLLKWFVSEQ